MAIRMATDLNLHRKSITSEQDTDEGRARDLEVSSVPLYSSILFLLMSDTIGRYIGS